MELPVLLQFQELLWALALGAGLGLLYDLLRPLRHGRWRTALTDALYVLLMLSALMLFALYAGRGRLRLFALAGMGCAGGLWLWLVSPLLRRLEDVRQRISRRFACRVSSVLRRLSRGACEQKKKFSENAKN